MTLKENWTEEDGVLWYQPPKSRARQRGRWRTCQKCGNPYPSLRKPDGYCSRRCWGQTTGGSNRVTRPDLFKHWTLEECWLAGLLWADGCLHDRGTKKTVVLGLVDEDAIMQAALVTGCHPRSSPQAPPRKTMHSISFGERTAIARLEAVGMGEPKLTTRPWPDLPHPGAFLRGVFDGDGSVMWHQQGGRRKTARSPLRLYSHISGSALLLGGVQSFLQGYGVAPKKIFLNGRANPIHRIGWNHADSMRVADAMYADAGPYMERKRATFYANLG
jgi:hypothetical protein